MISKRKLTSEAEDSSSSTKKQKPLSLTASPSTAPIIPQDHNDASMISQHQSATDTNLSKTKIFQLLKLPGEIRNMIYCYSANWNDVVRKVEEINHEDRKAYKIISDVLSSLGDRDDYQATAYQMRDEARRDRKQMMGSLIRKISTPTVLLLCRQVTREALGILHSTPFVITAASLSPAWARLCPTPPRFKEFFWIDPIHPSRSFASGFQRNVGKIHIELPDHRRIPLTDDEGRSLADWSGPHIRTLNAMEQSWEWLGQLPKLEELCVSVEGDANSRVPLKPTRGTSVSLYRFLTDFALRYEPFEEFEPDVFYEHLMVKLRENKA